MNKIIAVEFHRNVRNIESFLNTNNVSCTPLHTSDITCIIVKRPINDMPPHILSTLIQNEKHRWDIWLGHTLFFMVPYKYDKSDRVAYEVSARHGELSNAALFGDSALRVQIDADDDTSTAYYGNDYHMLSMAPAQRFYVGTESDCGLDKNDPNIHYAFNQWDKGTLAEVTACEASSTAASYYFFDIDGTLTPNKKSIQPELTDMLRTLTKNGKHVIIVSGRSDADIHSVFDVMAFYTTLPDNEKRLFTVFTYNGYRQLQLTSLSY